MPGGDGTGPLGLGGWCTPYRKGGLYARPAGSGCGFRWGSGRGMRWRFRYMPTPTTKEDELQILTEEASLLEARLNEIKKRIEELKN